MMMMMMMMMIIIIIIKYSFIDVLKLQLKTTNKTSSNLIKGVFWTMRRA